MNTNEELAFRTALYAVQHLEEVVADLESKLEAANAEVETVTAYNHRLSTENYELHNAKVAAAERIEVLEARIVEQTAPMTADKWWFVENLGTADKIRGIKLLRHMTNLGLKEAKALWESHFESHNCCRNAD